MKQRLSPRSGAFRDIRLDNSLEPVVAEYSSYLKKHWLLSSKSLTLANSPKFWSESLAILMLTTASLYMSLSYGLANSIPRCSCFRGQKLIPAVQTIFGSISTIKSQSYTWKAIVDMTLLNILQF